MSTMVDSRWDSRYQPHQGPITSGFVSNSDIQQKERKEQIKWERQREYDDLMTKQNPPVYYKTGATELSLPLGRYEESRRVLDDQRQQEYNQYITQKKDLENKRREELYMNARQNYKPPPEPEMYDHNQISKDLREERQKEYNDYLAGPNMSYRHYEDRKKMLSQERKNEYNEYLDKKREHENQLARHRKPPTPPGGLNIATEQERKRIEDMKKTTYRDELLKQQKEQLYNRAQQQGEVPVLNRASPTQALANRTSPRSPPRGRPPPHPDSGRRRGPPPQDERMGQNSMPEGTYRPQDPEFRTGFFDDRRRSPPNRDERQHDYQDYLAKKQREDEYRRQKLEEQRHVPQTEIPKGDFYSSETYEQKRRALQEERHGEYKDFLSKQKENEQQLAAGDPTDFQTQRRIILAQERNKEYNKFLDETNRPSYRQFTPESLQGLPIGQKRYDQLKHFQEVQRNKEYNEHLAKKGEKITSEDELLTRRDATLKDYMDNQLKSEMHDKFRDFTKPEIEGPEKFGLPIGQFRYEDWQKHQKEERSREYKEMQSQKFGNQQPKRMPDQPPSNSIGFMASLGFHERERDKLNKERQGEYRKYLDEKSQLEYEKMMEKWKESWEESWFRQEPPPFNRSPAPGRDQEPPRDRPGSYRRRQTPSYDEILESKRKQEMAYRRFDDPEYSRTGGQGGYRDERPYERYEPRGDERNGPSNYRPSSRERQTDRNRYNEGPTDRPTERPGDRFVDGPNDRPIERPGERPMDRPREGPMERPRDYSLERRGDRPMNGLPDRYIDRSGERPMERQMDQPFERPTEGYTDRPGDTRRNRPSAGYMNRPMARGPASPPRY